MFDSSAKTIRRAEEKDLSSIARINATVFLGDRDRPDSAARWIDCWFRAFPLYQYFVIERESAVVGYAGWQVHGGFLRAEPVIELDQIGIDPKMQGKGIAPLLMRECIDTLVAWTQETNDRIESHVTFVVWGYSFNFNALSVYGKNFSDSAQGFRIMFGERAETMLRLRRPIIRPVRDAAE